MDTIYIGDIPLSYKYARFGNDYIDLFNVPNATNGTFNYYRIYYNAPGFIYSYNTQSFGYNLETFQEVSVTDNFAYRKDFGDICLVAFIICFASIFILNAVTSVFKKGGVLGGLL